MGRGREAWPLHKLQAFGRAQQCHGGYSLTFPRQAQLDVKSANLPNFGGQVGTTHRRPLCYLSKHSNCTVQLTILGRWDRSRGRVCSELVGRKQLYKPTLGSATENSGEDHSRKSNSDRNSTFLSCSDVVPPTETSFSKRTLI